MNFGYRLWSIVSRAHISTHLHRNDVFCPSLSCRTMSSPQKDFQEDLVKNPYYEKYAKKIHDLQKSAPEDFKSRVEECEKMRAKPKFGLVDDGRFSSVSQPKESLSNGKHYKTKALSDIMIIDLIKHMSAKAISKLWDAHFKDKDCSISATIPVDIYAVIHERGSKFPAFILPLPRGQGYEFFLCQVERHEVHFTSLINYQAHQENAPECLAIVHYPELESKGIVLMHGEFNKEVLNAKEAQCLANQFQLYYGRNNEKRLKLLERLNYNPNDFKHMDLIAELECLSTET